MAAGIGLGSDSGDFVAYSMESFASDQENELGGGQVSHAEIEQALDEFFQQSDDYLQFAIDKCRNPSWGEHAGRLGITLTALAGSAAFWSGVRQVIDEIGNNPEINDLSYVAAFFSLVFSALPFAAEGIKIMRGLGDSSDVGKIFLEPTLANMMQYTLALSVGAGSALPLGGLTLVVYLGTGLLKEIALPLTAWLGHTFGTAAIAIRKLRFAGISSYLQLTDEKKFVLECIARAMTRRIEANHNLIIDWVKEEERKTKRLLEKLGSKPVPVYPGLKGATNVAKTLGATGITGYAGSTGYFWETVFNFIYVPVAQLWQSLTCLILDSTTAASVYLFFNMLLDAAISVISGVWKTLVDIGRSPANFLSVLKEKQGIPGYFFPGTFSVICGTFFPLGTLTMWTNFASCRIMTPLVIDALTLRLLTLTQLTKKILDIVSKVARWPSSIAGAILSYSFNTLGSIHALGDFLLAYGRRFLNAEQQTQLDNANGAILYLEGFIALLPTEKRVLLLEAFDEKTKEEILKEAQSKEIADEVIESQQTWSDWLGTIFCCRKKPEYSFSWDVEDVCDIVQQRNAHKEAIATSQPTQGWGAWIGSFFGGAASAEETEPLTPRAPFRERVCCSII